MLAILPVTAERRSAIRGLKVSALHNGTWGMGEAQEINGDSRGR